MGKFKVGDRVRVIDNTGAPSRYANGETGLVEETYAGNMVRLAGKSAGMYEHRFEAWRPKVGERVRFLRDSTAGGARYGAAGEGATVAKVYWNPEEVDVKLDVNSGGVTFNPSAYVKDLEPLLVTEAAPVVAEVQAAAWTIDSAVPGDVVTPTNWSGDFFTDGKPYEVSAASMIRSNHGCEYPLYGVNHGKWRLVTAASTTLTIEAGKFYKTRDGRKVLVKENGKDGIYPWYHDNGNGGYHGLDKDGKSCIGSKSSDLIGEWVDEPTAEPAEASSDNGVKVGDKVRALVDDIDITEGHVYDVLEVYEDGDVRVKDDMGDNWTIVAGDFETVDPDVANDNAEPSVKPKFKVGDIVGSTGNSWTKYRVLGVDGHRVDVESLNADGSHAHSHGWFEEDLFFTSEVVNLATPSTPAIVALIENGTAKPATRPKVHADQESATTEAERLALQFPGQQFGVFVLANSKIADVVNVPTAVLRAA